MKRFFSWVVILALVLSGCGETAASSDASSGTGSQQSAATETDAAEAEATEQTAEQSAEDDAEDTSDSETVLVNLVTFMYYGEGVTATYTYDSSGNTTSAVYAYTYSDYTDYTATCYYTYDEAGNLTGEDYIYEYEYGYDFNGLYLSEMNLEYDAAGKLVSEEMIYSTSEETTPYGVFVYSYDGNVGTATATVQFGGETYTETRTVTYNEAGVLLSKNVYYEEEGNSYYRNRSTYDEAGRVISSITMQSDGYTWTYTYNYTNDTQGNLLTYSTEKEEGYVDGEIYGYYYRYYEFSYNEDNELETISQYSSREEGGTLTLDTVGTYRYHYLDNGLLESVDGCDENGDWEYELFYFEYEAAVLLPADKAEAVQEAQSDRIRAFLRDTVM